MVDLSDLVETRGIEYIGKESWLRTFRCLHDINLICLKSAIDGTKDDKIVQVLISQNKLPLLVYEVVLSAFVWRSLSQRQKTKSRNEETNGDLLIFMISHYEATIVNLLETIMFDQTVVTSLDALSIIELVDYCYRTIASSIYQKDDYTAEGLCDNGDIAGKSILRERELCLKLIAVSHYIIDALSRRLHHHMPGHFSLLK